MVSEEVPDLADPAAASGSLLGARRFAPAVLNGSPSATARSRATAWTGRRPRSPLANARHGCPRAGRPCPWRAPRRPRSSRGRRVRRGCTARRAHSGSAAHRRVWAHDGAQQRVHARASRCAGRGSEALGHGEQAGACVDLRATGRSARFHSDITDHLNGPNGRPTSTGVNAALSVLPAASVAAIRPGRPDGTSGTRRRIGLPFAPATQRAALVVPYVSVSTGRWARWWSWLGSHAPPRVVISSWSSVRPGRATRTRYPAVRIEDWPATRGRRARDSMAVGARRTPSAP